MLAACPWYMATDADKAGDNTTSEWPASAIRARPPGGVKDWTELWQAACNSIRYLPAQHWGPALNDPTPAIIIDRPA